jgi:hypothetical protein
VDAVSASSAAVAKNMNAGTLFLYIVLPAIFLVVATGNPENMRVKGVCIALAYLSLIVLDGWMCIANPTASPADKNDSPFGLVFILISLWAFTLVGFGGSHGRESDDGQ